MRQAIGLISSALTTLILAGCGGGSGSSDGTTVPTGVSTGTFVDAYVEGLEFESPTQRGGVTDSNGNFAYKEGETVTFHIGNLYLGSAVPKNGKVTPLDIVGTTDVNDPKVVRILQTLQTLDSDGNSTNVYMKIDTAITETLKAQSRVDITNATDADVLAMIGKNEYAVTPTEAKSNFTPSLPSNASQGYTPPNTTVSSIISPTEGNGKYTLVAWNDLGMHCVDGKDYSVFSILPPYNNLHAHLISKDATTGKNVTSGVTITYEAVTDTTGSINTTSVTKTNFWDWVLSIFGGRPADDRGLNLSNPAISNPTPNLTPAGMTYNSTHGWWEAEGIPIMPYDDKGVKNYYPMVKVVAKSGSTVLATTKVVLPVSDEMSCISCHASNSVVAAKPMAGWVNNAVAEKDWKQNILKLHDDKHPTAIADANMSAKYTKGTLFATAAAGQPILCAACHKSNALGTTLIPGIKPLTEALHSKHANVIDPATNKTMNDSNNRESCYKCHPGSVTKCLRGTMGNAKKADGKTNAIDCQSCHGTMSDVGKTGREGWLDQPNCQQCHDRNGSTSANFARFTSVFSSGSTLRTTLDNRFATNPNNPMVGKSLYRFSKGHGNLQCESCHGATHAEYPSSHANDNVQSIALQGHTGTIAECTTCHTTVPGETADFAKGPHGMHVVGQNAVSKHKDAGKNKANCTACHGTDYRGSILSKTWTARTLNVEDGKTKTYAKGQMVSCYDCHNGPNGE